jgi:hypothetical protein
MEIRPGLRRTGTHAPGALPSRRRRAAADGGRNPLDRSVAYYREDTGNRHLKRERHTARGPPAGLPLSLLTVPVLSGASCAALSHGRRRTAWNSGSPALDRHCPANRPLTG